METEWPSRLRRWFRHAPSPVRTRPQVAFFFGQSRAVTHGRYLRSPLKNSAKKTYTCSKKKTYSTYLPTAVPQISKLINKQIDIAIETRSWRLRIITLYQPPGVERAENLCQCESKTQILKYTYTMTWCKVTNRDPK